MVHKILVIGCVENGTMVQLQFNELEALTILFYFPLNCM